MQAEATAEVTEQGWEVPAEGGEAYWFTSFRMSLKATAETTGGAFGLVEGLGAPGSSPPLHVHSREDEVFVLLDGAVTVRCGERTFAAEQGSVVFLPRGVPHSFVVEGDAPARILSFCLPGGFEQFFADAGRAAGGDGLPPQGPPDVELLQRVGAGYGLAFVGSPLAATRR